MDMIFRPRPYAPAFRLSPRAVMREASVVGFMPSNSAAPRGPKDLAASLLERCGNAFSFLALQFVARQHGRF